MSLGQIIKELRKTQNLSRVRLAGILGLSYWALSKYENDEREPDYQTLIRLADHFGVSMDFLFERKLPSTSNYFIDLTGVPGEIREDIRSYAEFKIAKNKNK
jgi:transcriptional regulator with XRE-family HTH domain